MNHDPVSPEITQESCPIDQPSSCCGGKHASTSQEHWDKTYKGAPFERLGWFESSPQPCLDLIQKCHLSFSDTLLIAGAGASTLVDALLDQGYQRLIATDISESGLNVLRDRLGPEKGSGVTWVVDDLTQSTHLADMEGKVALWHDRAVLHFLTEEKDQRAYFDLLRHKLQPGGYVILAEYAKGGATKCNGLPVVNYDANMLAERLGEGFELVDEFSHTYLMPSGEERKYIYTRFIKTT